MNVSFFAAEGFPLIEAGQPLIPAIIDVFAANDFILKDNDILILAQKIISKSENRYLELSSLMPSKQAQDLAQQCQKDPRLVQAVLDESTEVIRCAPGVLIVRHRLGFSLANAGIDQSNIEIAGERVLLLPENPDSSAIQLRIQVAEQLGVDVGVVINDSFGRPWRLGTTGVCIGCAGIVPITDQRGDNDLFGRELQVTQVAFGDEIAAAGSLLMGGADEGRPLVVARGLSLESDNISAAALVRNNQDDLFK